MGYLYQRNDDQPTLFLVEAIGGTNEWDCFRSAVVLADTPTDAIVQVRQACDRMETDLQPDNWHGEWMPLEPGAELVATHLPYRRGIVHAHSRPV